MTKQEIKNSSLREILFEFSKKKTHPNSYTLWTDGDNDINYLYLEKETDVIEIPLNLTPDQYNEELLDKLIEIL